MSWESCCRAWKSKQDTHRRTQGLKRLVLSQNWIRKNYWRSHIRDLSFLIIECIYTKALFSLFSHCSQMQRKDHRCIIYVVLYFDGCEDYMCVSNVLHSWFGALSQWMWYFAFVTCAFCRQMAKECRHRKREYLNCLEVHVSKLELQNKKLMKELKYLLGLKSYCLIALPFHFYSFCSACFIFCFSLFL